MQRNRKSQRKKDYDYSQPGYYAVTLCTQNRSCLFGIIDKDDMLLNNAGRMINETWHDIPIHYPGVELDEMQIMPNHLHGIIVVCEVGTAPRGRPNPGIENGQAQGPVPTGYLSLPDVIERFKSLTTTRYIGGVKNERWYPFPGKLWQRSYHDRIIRNEIELNLFKTYICNNPAEWDTDENNIEIKRKTEQANSEARFQRP
jgi:REP element-mobilizing transposase RayT